MQKKEKYLLTLTQRQPLYSEIQEDRIWNIVSKNWQDWRE